MVVILTQEKCFGKLAHIKTSQREAVKQGGRKTSNLTRLVGCANVRVRKDINQFPLLKPRF